MNDIFGYAFEKLNQALEGKTANQISNIYETYKTNKNLTSRYEPLLDEKLSSAMAWQMDQVCHKVFSDYDNDFKDTKPVWSRGSRGQDKPMGDFTVDSDTNRQHEVAGFPPLCFRLRIHVHCLSPIVIQGDRPFVAHENPFSTDKVTGLPLLRPGSLKGQFRNALWTVSDGCETAVTELTGAANDDDDTGGRSRIEFLPAYADKPIRYRVITPHDEKTRRVDPGPVTLEVLEPPQPLILWLQYWPVDCLHQWVTGKPEKVPGILLEDVTTITDALGYWFSDRMGIGAKTAAGFGRVDSAKTTVTLFAPDNSPWRAFAADGNTGASDVSLEDLSSRLKESGRKDNWTRCWKTLAEKKEATGRPYA